MFATPPLEVLHEKDFAAALARSVHLTGRGISQQSFALGVKILEVADLASREPRVHEVHPEVSFRAMSQGVVFASKKTWNGQMQRRAYLASEAVEVPDVLLGVLTAGADDVLDAAAAAAWSG